MQRPFTSSERPPSPFGHFPNKLGKTKLQYLPKITEGGVRLTSFPNSLGKCPKGDGGLSSIIHIPKSRLRSCSKTV